MSKVSVIGGTEPNINVIELLEELLEEAKKGSLSAFIGIADYYDREPDYIHVGIFDWWAIRGRLDDLAAYITEVDEE